MATITIKKELQDFLEKEGILEAFIENVKRNRENIKLLTDWKITGINTAFRTRGVTSGRVSVATTFGIPTGGISTPIITL